MNAILKLFTPLAVEDAPAAAPPDPLAERERISAQYFRLNEIQARVGSAENALAAIDADVAALNELEARTIGEWAVGGEGDAPQGEFAARKALCARRDEALLTLAGATIAARAIEPKLLELNASMADIHVKLSALSAKRIVAEALELAAEIDRLADDLRAPIARLTAAREALFQRAQRENAAGHSAAASLFGSAGEQLARLRAPVIAPGANEVGSYVSSWLNKFN